MNTHQLQIRHHLRLLWPSGSNLCKLPGRLQHRQYSKTYRLSKVATKLLLLLLVWFNYDWTRRRGSIALTRRRRSTVALTRRRSTITRTWWRRTAVRGVALFRHGIRRLRWHRHGWHARSRRRCPCWRAVGRRSMRHRCWRWCRCRRSR